MYEEAAIAVQLNDKTVTIGSASNEAYTLGCVTKYNNLLLFPYAVGTCNLGSQCLCREIVSSSSQVCDLGEGFFSDLPGLAANGWSGTQTTNSDCQACPDGTYSPANDGRCAEKGCTCSDGTAATGLDCPNDGDAKCASCDTGYYLSGNECALKTCTCSHGTAATGSDCPNDGDAKCASCNIGFFLSGNECALKTCTCSNGVEAKGGACPTHGSEKCISCDAGFFLNGNECALRMCICSYGVEATGVACPTHGSEKCISCEDGNHLVNDLCWINWCDCLNGEGERGIGCPNHLAFKCKSCNAAYSLEGTECVENQCTCAHGTSATGTDCPTHGEAKCVSCDEGFNLDGTTCECNAGYYFEGTECVENQCTCFNGISANGTDCPTHGEAKCVSCNEEFNLEGTTCNPVPKNCLENEHVQNGLCVPCPSGQSNPAGDSNIGGNTYCKKIQFVALHVPYTGMHNPQVDYSCEDKGYETIRSLQLCKNALRPTLGIWWNIFETDSKPGYGCFEGCGLKLAYLIHSGPAHSNALIPHLVHVR